ncbi:3-dehydrosphinganine reductase TSC10A (3-ketodihydrosphingosine reductase) (KDS reductase) (3-ketosphinganine reductase) [Durusdinium trenchii]|uniref:3-dehydrosphinganine reductase TSC10A (3-ketodihydrosphingosine reductase) (KDS reductase) (3-ketosphinganine reductase) n=1 Tax=Durusdinium trenchii TaxID=1381693 RepID=A0ABP0JA50_9DINO
MERRLGAKIQHLAMDVSAMRSAHFAELLGEAASEGFGRVDVVVCNAGTGVAKLLVGTSLEQIDELMDAQISTNLLGSLRCATAAAQVMASDGQGGRVAIVSSAAGLISLPGYAVYSATKFGHRGFLAGAGHELEQHGVHLSVYYPGSIATPGFEHEKQLMPTVTARIESSCSDVSKPEDAAAVLLAGIERGTKEITNELLPSLVVDFPTGFTPLDACVAAVVQIVRAGWSIYLRAMSRQRPSLSEIWCWWWGPVFCFNRPVDAVFPPCSFFFFFRRCVFALCGAAQLLFPVQVL